MREWNVFHEKVINAKLKPRLEAENFVLEFYPHPGGSYYRTGISLTKDGIRRYPHTQKEIDRDTHIEIIDFTLEEIVEHCESLMDTMNEEIERKRQ